MTTTITAQNIDLWEAWVDVQYADEQPTATLFVIGDVVVNNLILEPRFEKRLSLPERPDWLLLEIVPNVLCEEGTEMEIVYAEKLTNVNQYAGVMIMVGGEVIVEMNDLDIIY
ncbi:MULTISPECIES: hypothetical protein [Chitinophagaceae]|uniref:hypothetical protein n=1 Tax=Chitinophagaceae TaxID=563835 RepID=UPI000DEFA0DA|nr:MULTISPECIES: hypothetical protein [Chitinophagaceae]RPD43611.1 hypothetical protein DRJ53_19340 [Paracnuella aquatica]